MVEYGRVFEEGQPAIRLSRPYTLRRVCSADGDGGIDISEDKSNHLLIKPSTRGLLCTVGGGTPLTLGYTGLGLAVLVRAMYSWGLKSSRYLPFIFRSDRSNLLMSPVGTYSVSNI